MDRCLHHLANTGYNSHDRDINITACHGKNIIAADVICGVLVGIAGLFFVGAYTTVQPGYGDQYNNEAIAGCVMGGTSMVGGLASIGGTVIGVFIISLLQQGIMAFGLGKGQQMIITGLIVIAAVYVDVSARRRKN